MKIPIDKVTKVYSGKPGCGCGCRGKYFTDARNIARVVSLMNDTPDKIMVDGNDPTIYAVDTANRSFWAYTGVAA